MPKHAVYISHSQADNAVIDRYVSALQARGFDVWYDRASLRAGDSASDVIERELTRRTAFVAFLSPSALASNWVTLETDAYFSLVRADPSRLFLAVLIAPCEIPMLLRNYRYLDAIRMPFNQVIDALALALTAPDESAIPLSRGVERDQALAKPVPHVFVSHSHKDNEFAMRLVDDLREAGVDVWVDVADVKHGNFIELIDAALAKCEWFVLVQTPNAIHSKAVRMETNAALNLVLQDRMRDVIPVIAAPCEPKEVPPMWSALHFYDATRDYASALKGVLRALDA